MSSDWDFRAILSFDPDHENQCVGIETFYRDKPRCTKCINKTDIREASYLLDQMDNSTSFPELSELRELAGLMLCKDTHNCRKKYHLNQIVEVSLKWQKKIDVEVKRREQEEREAGDKSFQELTRMLADLEADTTQIPELNDVKIPVKNTRLREPTFEVFRDQPLIATPEVTTAQKSLSILAADSYSHGQVAALQVKKTSIASRGQAPLSTTMTRSSVFLSTPDIVAPVQNKVPMTIEMYNEMPSTPKTPVEIRSEEHHDTKINTPLPLTPDSLFSFGDSSRHVNPQFDFGFTPASSYQLLTPPSSVKSTDVFGPLLASRDQPRLFALDDTPTPERSRRIPLGPKSTPTHNTKYFKELVSPVKRSKQDSTLPLRYFDTDIFITEPSTNRDPVLEANTQRETEVEIDELNEKASFDDSPTVPSDFPTPSQTIQTLRSSKEVQSPTPKYLPENHIIFNDHINGDQVPLTEHSYDMPLEGESELDENKENLEPATVGIFNSLSNESNIYPESDLENSPLITTDISEDDFGYVTIISATTSYPTTYIPKQERQPESSTNCFSPADLQNRTAKYGFPSNTAWKPLPPLPASQPITETEPKPQEQVQMCEACGEMRLSHADTCYCFDESEIKKVPLKSGGCLPRLGLKKLKEKVVKKLKQKNEKRK